MIKANFNGGAWGNAALAFHVAGEDCMTDGDTEPCERMRIMGNGNLGIGTTSPDNSALMDLSSTNKGFLPPRMTSIQRTTIVTPAAGLLVFQTDSPVGYYYYTGTTWVGLADLGSISGCIDYDGNAYPTITIGA